MRVCILSQTPIADDPRVRRQGDALHRAGHDVVALGVRGAHSGPPAWPVIELRGPSRTLQGKVLTSIRTQAARMPPLADAVYWSFREHREMRAAAVDTKADVYHANDWRVLPVAAAAAAATGARYVYDSHEFAVEENIVSRAWRFTFPHYIRAIEARHIHEAGFVSTVGAEIASLMQDAYRLPERPVVIRNVPDRQAMPYRDPGDPMVVLYHGKFNADRGLVDLVRSVAGWRDGLRLVVRGWGTTDVESQIRRAVEDAGVGDRVTIEPPAPMSELVGLANLADIGVHPMPPSSRQTRFALPNKFFEYVMAGLAVCVTDAPEMARIVREYECGIVVTDARVEGIAAAVNSLTPERVAAFKRASLVAAEELCWDREQSRLLDAYAALAPP